MGTLEFLLTRFLPIKLRQLRTVFQTAKLHFAHIKLTYFVLHASQVFPGKLHGRVHQRIIGPMSRAADVRNFSECRNHRRGIASFGIRQPYLLGHEFCCSLPALQECDKSVRIGTGYFSIGKDDQINFKCHFYNVWLRAFSCAYDAADESAASPHVLKHCLVQTS